MSLADALRTIYAYRCEHGERLSACEACLERPVAPVGRQGVTVKEFAAIWGVSPRTVERAIRSGAVRAVHFGRVVRVPMSEVERLGRGTDG